MTPGFPTSPPEATAGDLVDRVRGLPGTGRRLVGITGTPGSGKSWTAGELATSLGEDAVVVAMDAFHLTEGELDRLGRTERKGAPDTFDVKGYLTLLLHQVNGWSGVRPLLDEVWYVEADEQTRLSRLVDRHIAHGKDPQAARRWAITSDQANAELIARSRSEADLVVRIQ